MQRQRAVRGEGRVAPRVGVDAAGAGDHPDHLHLARGAVGQAPGALQPLEHHRVVEGEPCDVDELGDNALDLARRGLELGGGDGAGDAAGHHGAPEQAVAGEARVEAQELLA